MRYADTMNIILDVRSEKLPQVFQNAREEGLTNHYYRYFLTSLVHTHQLILIISQSHVSKHIWALVDDMYCIYALKDIHTLQKQDIIFGEVNITALRLVDPASLKVVSAVESWHYRSAFASHNYPDSPFASRYWGSNGGGPLSEIPILRNNMIQVRNVVVPT